MSVSSRRKTGRSAFRREGVFMMVLCDARSARCRSMFRLVFLEGVGAMSTCTGSIFDGARDSVNGADGGANAPDIRVKSDSGTALPATGERFRRLKRFQELLFAVVDIAALGTVYVVLLLVQFCSFLFTVVLASHGCLDLLGVPSLAEQREDRMVAFGLAGALLVISVVSWRIGTPVGALLERRKAVLTGTRRSGSASSRWSRYAISRLLRAVKERLFAGIDVLAATLALVVLILVTAGASLGLLDFIYEYTARTPKPDYLGGDLAMAAVLVVTFLVSLRCAYPTDSYLRRRWNVLIGRHT